ncbi:MAG: periplasmic heavy metal sensor [Phycisphaerales bacterium]|nr:periplasmic heavy metal sensor [Phycisphaerales bacterium]
MTRLLIIAGFLIAFAAGWVVGLKWPGTKESSNTRSGRHGGWLAAELKLSPEQKEQLREIWSDTARRGGRERMDRRRQAARERDEAIAALIRPEDKTRYEEILKEHAEQSGEQDREWRESYQAAVERTKAILTPEQRVRYEELLQRQQWDRPSRDRHRGERESGRRGERRATTRPE